MTGIIMQFCEDCLAGNCGICIEEGPELGDGTVCECEHDDLPEAERLAPEDPKD